MDWTIGYWKDTTFFLCVYNQCNPSPKFWKVFFLFKKLTSLSVWRYKRTNIQSTLEDQGENTCPFIKDLTKRW